MSDEIIVNILGDNPTEIVVSGDPPVEVIVSGGVGPAGPAGPPGTDGAGGSQSLIHDQQVAASTWTIIHAWSGYPSVTVIGTDGSTLIGEVIYTSPTRVDINFIAAGEPFAVSGKALLN